MHRKLFTLALCLVLVVGVGIAQYVHSQGNAGRGGPGATAHIAPQAIAFRIMLGRGDAAPTAWDGSIVISAGTLIRLEGWRFRQGDQVIPPDAWKASSRREGTGPRAPVLPNGILVTLDATPQTDIRVTTPRGMFDFKPASITSENPTFFLQNAVAVERCAAEFRLASGPGASLPPPATEDDFPAAATAQDGTIWIAYVAYRIGSGDIPIMRNYTQEPANFDNLVPKGNGDQVHLARISADGTTFTDVAALTEPGQDVLHPAIAVDNEGGVMAVWSQNVRGNLDLYARRYKNGQLSPVQRLTTDVGPDIAPALAREDNGTLWLTWQGFRNGRSAVFLRSLPNGGDVWSAPVIVSDSPWNNWDPSIACAHDGSVYVAWDTYDKGDYDVRMRRMVGGSLEPMIPVANTPQFEARTSLTCDAQNRAWVAYEVGTPEWGKDYGFLVQNQGTPLYSNHSVDVRCFVDGKPSHTAGAIADSFQVGLQRRAAPRARLNQQAPRQGVQRSYPRLGTDKSGRVYLTYRQNFAELRVRVGTSWLSYVTTYDGASWTPAQLLPDSDAVLDNRPAIVPASSGQVALIHASDGRNHAFGANPHYGLYCALISLQVGNAPPQLVADPPPGFHQISPETVAERQDVQRMHNYRAQIGGKTYQLLRGDFHRHTEISMDGGNDGPLADMFRYAIDAAAQDWICAGDHDYGLDREYTWWQIQKLDDAFHIGPQFVPIFGCERSVAYPNGHRNVMFVERGIRPLPRLNTGNGISPNDTKMLYRYLHQFNGICAPHTSATNQGTDWRDHDPAVEPVVEIYQGDRQSYEYEGAPRSGNKDNSVSGFRPEGFIWKAFEKGIKFGFEASSDHHSTHISYGVAFTETPTREGIFDAFRKRHTYAATDNILADVRCGEQMMGDEFTTKQAPRLHIMAQGTNKIARVVIVKNNKVVATLTPNTQMVDLAWMDNEAGAGQSYYYVRIEQVDGQLAWVSPLWITYAP